MSLLEVEKLTHSFGDNVLYRNAGFTLNKGEHIGIVGQNGTGKVSASQNSVLDNRKGPAKVGPLGYSCSKQLRM